MAKRLSERALETETHVPKNGVGREFCRNCGGDIILEAADHRSSALPHRRVCRKCSAEYGTTAATLYPVRKKFEWPKSVVLAILALACSAVCALAGDAPETQRCVQTYEIRQTRVVDDSTVMFRLRVDDEYANHLRRSCPGLRIQGGFKYELRGGNELCRGDIIRVLDSTGTGASCILGDFEKVEKKTDQPSAK
jgi:DNA-directed RNA polymerase subunit M/transcription elongation factor TFIIS